MKENTSEEIDLGELFRLIGNALNRCIKFIDGIFKNLFHLFILFLKFIRAHFLKFVTVTFIGAIIGGYLDYKSLPVYKSSMIIEPNFNSVQQLYNNIEFYNQLAEHQESKALSEALQVSENEASYIKKVTIESFSDETQRIKQFSEFISGLDSISQKQVDYEYYLKNFNDINAKFHRIQIEATSPEIAKRCQKAIVTSIENNEYFRLQKEINDRNIALKDSVIDIQQEEINDLQAFYKKIKIMEAQKPDGITNINLAENQSDQVSEIELLNQAGKLKDEKIELNNEKANTKNTINIISEFPNKGALVNDFMNKKIVLVPIVFVTILFLILILISLNTYLMKYDKLNT
ncbi:hypothetical protein ATO12_22745 [Aquimarina atlantica]|uniref:Uncharacterized protein n=1 Tax=Aquimarina atlantica TaxID=1317122 RepID=A0A023BR95_9FLAO|nr:hypothetical protein [Aquimarina atlantica]EZH72273.1 hypothetical protein ATO12_22745 [Aquimarina atlantica]